MKPFIVFVMALVFVANVRAADGLTEKLQRGLFEEEANHNLDAAIKSYESVIQQGDEQRKLIATAILRLGECYRKLGRTNEAGAQYQRIVRDFSEQEQLVRLANDFLKPATGTGVTARESGMTSPSWKTVSDPDQVRLLQEEIKLAEQQVAAVEKNHAAGVVPLAAVLNAKREVLAVRRLLPENSSLLRQKSLLNEQVKIVEQLLKETEERVTIGVVPVTEPIPLRRELLTLRRETAALTDSVTANASAPAQPAMTQAEAEELARVKSLAQNSPDLLNVPYKDRLTPLQFAVREGFSSVTAYLVSQGVNINAPSPLPPLVIAADRGHLRIVELLIEKGAEKNAVGKRSPEGGGIYFDGDRTALMRASTKGFKSIVDLLIARGVDVNLSASDGMTALLAATHEGRAAIVESLLKSGAEIGARITRNNSDLRGGSYGGTPLHIAALGSFANIAELLLKKGANVSGTNLAGETPLHLAAKVGHTNVTALLLASGADANLYASDGNTPLTFAVGNNQPDEVEFLLRSGADPNKSTTNGSYPIHLTSQPETMRALLTATPNLEVTNRFGYTAVRNSLRNAPVLQLLLEAGANPNAAGPVPVLLLVVAEGNKASTALLLKHGANPNVLDADNRTPFSIASSHCKQHRTLGQINYTTFCEIASLLREHRANPDLHRQGGIYVTREGGNDMAIFSRGTNDVNRYALLELIAAAYQDGGTYFPFPDFAKVEIRRNTEGRPETNRIDVAKILAEGSCTNAVWLQWGDNVEIPMKDHPAQESWRALWNAEAEALADCLRRTVRLNFAGIETNVALYPMVRSREGRYESVAAKWRGLPFRLSNVVQEQPLLRASSDLTRIKVIRADMSTGQKREMLFDVTQVRLPHMSYPVSPPLSWEHDLWLRDGDVIEIPEKQ